MIDSHNAADGGVFNIRIDADNDEAAGDKDDDDGGGKNWSVRLVNLVRLINDRRERTHTSASASMSALRSAAREGKR